MAVVGLYSCQSTVLSLIAFQSTHVKLALDFAIAAELDKDNLVEQKTDEVERLSHVAGSLSSVGHCVYFVVVARTVSRRLSSDYFDKVIIGVVGVECRVSNVVSQNDSLGRPHLLSVENLRARNMPVSGYAPMRPRARTAPPHSME